MRCWGIIVFKLFGSLFSNPNFMRIFFCTFFLIFFYPTLYMKVNVRNGTLLGQRNKSVCSSNSLSPPCRSLSLKILATVDSFKLLLREDSSTILIGWKSNNNLVGYNHMSPVYNLRPQFNLKFKKWTKYADKSYYIDLNCWSLNLSFTVHKNK